MGDVLGEDFKFAADCEFNDSIRRADALRSQLLQLEARRPEMDFHYYGYRQNELMQSYSVEIDRLDGSNTYRGLINYILNRRSDIRKCSLQDLNLRSVLHQRMEQGLVTAKDIIRENDPRCRLEPLMKLSAEFRATRKDRIVPLNISLPDEDGNDNDDDDEIRGSDGEDSSGASLFTEDSSQASNTNRSSQSSNNDSGGAAVPKITSMIRKKLSGCLLILVSYTILLTNFSFFNIECQRSFWKS